MKMTLNMTLDGLVRALRWRQIDFLENPAKELQVQESSAVIAAKSLPSKQGSIEDVQ